MIVAFFNAILEMSITASGGLALIDASVGIDCVAVIAALKAGLSLSDIASPKTISASGCSTGVGAGIEGVDVCIITSLKVRRIFGEIIAHDTVAAARHLARVRTGIGVDRIAVITPFALIEASITASLLLALR